MRIALVSPYSWTYPGGVTRHIEALAEQFDRLGHDVRVLAPHDPHDRMSARLHRGAWPAGPRAAGLPGARSGARSACPCNGAVSNSRLTPSAVATLRRELAAGGFDVVHIHEPVAPVVGWDALDFQRRAARRHVPLLLRERRLTNGLGNAIAGARRKLNRLHVRIAVSEAAAWTGRRFYGGRYRIIPNGVDAGRRRVRRPPRPLATAHGCASPSSARPSSARGCRSCCAPSRRCASTSPPSWSSSAPGPTTSRRCCSTTAA